MRTSCRGRRRLNDRGLQGSIVHARDLSRLILGHFGHGITDFDIQGMTQRSRDHALASRPQGVPLYKVFKHSFVRDDDR